MSILIHFGRVLLAIPLKGEGIKQMRKFVILKKDNQGLAWNNLVKIFVRNIFRGQSI